MAEPQIAGPPQEAEVWEVARGKDTSRPVLRRGRRLLPAPGPGEVLVRIHACSLNARDLLQLDGLYPDPGRAFVVASDAAGEIVALSPDVTGLVIGDRVVNHGLPGWEDGPFRSEKRGVIYGGPDDGTMATHRVFRADTLVKISDHLTFEDASTLNCAGLTAWSAIVLHSHAVPGETVVIQGTGGVSLFALQFAKLAGLKTIVTSSSDAKLERVRALGADHCLNYRNDDWPRQVRELSGGGATAIVEVAGTIDPSVRCLRTGGTLLSVGVLAGANPSVNLPMIMMRAIRIQGVTLGSRSDMVAMVRALAANTLRPVIDRVFPFDALEDAFEHYRAGHGFGKVVVAIP